LRLRALASRTELEAALQPAAWLLLFISPASVRFARALDAGLARRGCAAAGVGAGTARALRAAGFADVLQPVADAAQTSEGLLAHPRLQRGEGRRVLLLGAPGGRGLLEPALRERGFQVQTLHLYRREPARLDARHLRALRECSPPLGLLLSSGEALDNVLAPLDADARARLLQATVAASSTRLAERARALGFARVVPADGPDPTALVRSLVAATG
jgi:uroporphyrinogen-III synthase